MEKGQVFCVDNPRTEYHVHPMGMDRARPRFSWEYLPGPGVQASYEVNVWNENDDLVWDSGTVSSSAQNQVEYDGEPLQSHRRYRWRVRAVDREGAPSAWSEDAFFDTGFLEGWTPKLVGHLLVRTTAGRLFRREFNVEGNVVSARLYGSAQGCCLFSLNGRQVAEEYFTPGWTDYRQRLYYRCWDVTGLLLQGGNCLAAEMSDGWYAGAIGGEQKRYNYGADIGLAAALLLRFADGREEWVESDNQWRTTFGPTLQASFLDGERHDATLAIAGWNRPGQPTGDWQPIVLREAAAGLAWHPGEPVRPQEELAVKEWWQPRPGAWIADFGQNFAGICRLRVEAPAGTIIRLRFGEVLTPDRTLYVDNLRSAEVTDEYVCCGQGVETWSPGFTFHGFRYVEVTGLTAPPNDSTLFGIPLWSDCPPAGEIQCSEPMVEQLASNALWTQRANYIEVPTDCPQRDERLGWTGDAQAYIRTAAWFQDVAAFHAKWLIDLDDAVTEDGRAPCVAPRPDCVPWDAGAGWGDATTVCPWTFYRVYGDRHLLEKHYPMMQRYIGHYRRTREPDSHVRFQKQTVTLSDGSEVPTPILFGDWLSVDAETATEIIMTAFYAYSVMLTARAARVLEKNDEADALEQEWQEIARDFNEAFVKEDGRIVGKTQETETQTGYCLALHFDLLPEEKRAAAAGHLVADIEKRDGHLSTGFLGLPYLLPVLSRFGQAELAYRLLLNRTYPSWGYEIEHGATTIWERWNGYHHEHGPGDPGMNSYSHYAYGAVCEWLFSDMIGLEALAPGFAVVRVRPRVGGGITRAGVRYRSIRGFIEAGWEISGGWVTGRLTLPANSEARLQLPADSRAEANGVLLERVSATEPGYLETSLHGGTHEWRYEGGVGVTPPDRAREDGR